MILVSPDGSNFRLKVDNDGTVASEKIPARGEQYIKPEYNAYLISEVVKMDFSNFNYSSLIVMETNLKYNIVNGVTSCQSSAAPGLRAYARISYIIDSLTSVITSATYGGIFIYNTDINKFYVLQGDRWAWAGTVGFRDSTNYRAVGTTAQRPAEIPKDFIYYDTTISSYVKWDGATWNNHSI